MSKEYQVEKAIVPGSFLEEEFLQMINFDNPANIFLSHIDYAWEAIRSTRFALHSVYAVTLFCAAHAYAPIKACSVASTIAIKPGPKIKMSFTFYAQDFIDRGYIEFELGAPNLPGTNAFTATVKIDGSDKKIYVKDVDGNYQEVGTIAGFRNFEFYTLSCTLDLINRLYKKIEIGWIKFNNIDITFETDAPWSGETGVAVNHWPKQNFESEIGVDNIIVKSTD